MAFIPTVEVPMFIIFFSQSISGPVNTNLMLYRTCYILLGHNKTKCSWLGNRSDNITQTLETEAQPINNQISLTHQLTESVIAVIISLLIGPWSDKFGRRPVFLLIAGALFASSISGLIFTYFEDISPWYGLIGGIPMMLCGGIYSFVIVANSYISELSTDENRGIRIAIFTTSMASGQLLGTFASAFLLNWTSYLGVMGTTVVLYFISILYTYFLIPESLTNIETEGIIAGFFDTTNLREMYYTTTKKRKDNQREIILLFTIVTALGTFTFTGDIQLMFLFLRQKYGWTIMKYTIFSGIQSTISIAGTMSGIYLFQKVFKLRESVAILMCYCMMLIGTLILGFSTVDWIIYMVSIIRCFDGAVDPMAVTVVAKIVEKHELGKVLAGMMGARFLCTLVASPTYTAVYNATIDMNSSIFNFESSGIFLLAIICLIATIWMENNREDSVSGTNKEPLLTVKEHMLC